MSSQDLGLALGMSRDVPAANSARFDTPKMPGKRLQRQEKP